MSLRNCIHLMWWNNLLFFERSCRWHKFQFSEGLLSSPPQGLSLITFAAPWCLPPHPNRIDQSPRSPLVPEGRWWWGVIFKGLFMRAPWRGGKLERTDHAWRTHYLDSPKHRSWCMWSPSQSLECSHSLQGPQRETNTQLPYLFLLSFSLSRHQLDAEKLMSPKHSSLVKNSIQDGEYKIK